MKKTIPAVLAGVLLASGAMFGLTACTATPSSETVQLSPDYPAYESVTDMASRATLVVEVILRASSSDVLLPKYQGGDPASNLLAGTDQKPDLEACAVPITVFDATVNAAYRADATQGDVIKVGELGGLVDGTEYTVVGSSPLKEGQTVLLFLETYPDTHRPPSSAASREPSPSTVRSISPGVSIHSLSRRRNSTSCRPSAMSSKIVANADGASLPYRTNTVPAASVMNGTFRRA